MNTLYYFLGFYCVAIVWCSQEDKFAKDDTSKSISSKDEKTVENIMSMIQETCTRDNRRKTVKHLHKDSKSILNKSKGHGGVASFMRAIKRDMNDICSPFRPRDCSELMKIKKHSGVYIIYPDKSTGSKGIEAYCDMKTDGGGWTVIQRRIDGSVNFERRWTEYENGFGNANREYWLGNKDIHLLTSKMRYKLKVDLIDSKGREQYAIYNTFKVGDAASKYKLTVGGYSGSAGDMLSYHNGYKFSTVDQDNDAHSSNCAAVNQGAWWYRACHHSSLNGKFQGKMFWNVACKRATMMIRKL